LLGDEAAERKFIVDFVSSGNVDIVWKMKHFLDIRNPQDLLQIVVCSPTVKKKLLATLISSPSRTMYMTGKIS